MKLLVFLVATFTLACGGGKNAADGGDGGVASDDGQVPVPDSGSADTAPLASGGDRGAVDGDFVSSPAKLTVTPTTIFIRTTTHVNPSSGVTIKNAGDSPTGPLVAVLTGPDADQFEVMWLRGQEGLTPGQKSDLIVTFDVFTRVPNPVFGVTLTAILTITDSGPGGSTAAVDITVVVIVASQGLAIVGPPDMGTVTLGTSGANLPFMVVNIDVLDSGPLRLSVSSPEIAIGADTCTGLSLPAAASCSFSARFSPTALGARWTVLTAQGTAEDMVASEFIAGTGVEN